MLNAEQIIEKGLLKLEHSKGKPAQIGYDISIKEIKSLQGVGKVLKDKTILPNYELYNTKIIDGKEGWMLYPGLHYEVTFWEGCNIPNNYVGLIRQRSSMFRNGVILHSSVFDPGFSTEFMGSFITVFHHVFVEKDSRIAQIYFHECEPVALDKLYNGQYQFDKQRT